jgi:hypothetical protein
MLWINKGRQTIDFQGFGGQGVELFSVLTARKLLILRMAEGKKGTIADSIVRLSYENLFAFPLVKSLLQAGIPQFSLLAKIASNALELFLSRSQRGNQTSVHFELRCRLAPPGSSWFDLPVFRDPERAATASVQRWVSGNSMAERCITTAG